jgi:hypothetical protein
MKQVNVVKTYWACEFCDRRFEDKGDAARCEKNHFKFQKGENVVYWKTSYGSAQGHIESNLEKLPGIVVDTTMDKCMVKFEDGSLIWCGNGELWYS